MQQSRKSSCGLNHLQNFYNSTKLLLIYYHERYSLESRLPLYEHNANFETEFLGRKKKLGHFRVAL